MHKIIINYIFILISLLFFSSCVLLKPLPLEPFGNAAAIQEINKFGMSALNGGYEIISVDSGFSSLDYALVYSELRYSKKNLMKTAYLNIEAIDDNHIKAKLFVNNEMVKQKIVHGKIINNYFEFHTTRLKFRFIINVYNQQTNRLALSKEGDLFLDTNQGGVGFLILLPIPLSGSSYDIYNVKFKRIK